MFEPAGAIPLEIKATHAAAAGGGRIAFLRRSVVDTARREMSMLCRGRALTAFAALLAVAAWLPPLLLSLRRGSLLLSPFGETVALALAFSEIAIPLVGLLCGADMIAGESEDGTLVPIVALPIPRGAIFAGKFLARSALLSAAYLAAFGSSAIAIALLKGAAGWLDYAAVTCTGLALCIAACAVGAMFGAAGGGRTRAFGAAVVAWVVMVFALDAILLAAVVVIAPAPPEDAAAHGYGEMAAQMEMMKLHEMDDDGQDAGPHTRGRSGASAPEWLMALDPVDLFRITAISASPVLHQRAVAAFGEVPQFAPLAASWLVWILLPLGVGIRRFARADLQ